ncbi:type VII secretion system-associated protein [Amycolatopsis rhizosphaerae]|uniref:Type VII secretion system-associated protein n=1 Tax=Amycolatopsis rhizosphaerae TaxID=2053003 RepID=A0A558DA30_9PSEU|nr:type VII secretion system-associated protein [Amycolatopsis rhizosphaerae]TVT57823.1 type VII secretion system-associated protein [Amycolatopsis rhizosphaerae]
MTGAPAQRADEGLLLVIDPLWTSSPEEPDPPVTAIAGAWEYTAEGLRGRFQPNPVYRPTSPDSPLDPVDEVLRRLARDGGGADDLPSALRTTMLGIAVDERGVALVRPAPDGLDAVLVTTAPGHRTRVPAPAWRDVTLERLAAALPAKGVDVLLNPGAPASMRVPADGIREIAAGERG